jgi:hypothetical protein
MPESLAPTDVADTYMAEPLSDDERAYLEALPSWHMYFYSKKITPGTKRAREVLDIYYATLNREHGGTTDA